MEICSHSIRKLLKISFWFNMIKKSYFSFIKETVVNYSKMFYPYKIVKGSSISDPQLSYWPNCPIDQTDGDLNIQNKLHLATGWSHWKLVKNKTDQTVFCFLLDHLVGFFQSHKTKFKFLRQCLFSQTSKQSRFYHNSHAPAAMLQAPRRSLQFLGSLVRMEVPVGRREVVLIFNTWTWFFGEIQSGWHGWIMADHSCLSRDTDMGPVWGHRKEESPGIFSGIWTKGVFIPCDWQLGCWRSRPVCFPTEL